MECFGHPKGRISHIRMDQGRRQIPNSVLGLTSRILTDLDAIMSLSSCCSSAPLFLNKGWPAECPRWPLLLIRQYQVADPTFPNPACPLRRTAHSRYPRSYPLSGPLYRTLDT